MVRLYAFAQTGYASCLSIINTLCILFMKIPNYLYWCFVTCYFYFKSLPVNAKHSSFQYRHSYIRVLIIFSTKYCGFVPFTEWASFTVLFAIFVVVCDGKYSRSSEHNSAALSIVWKKGETFLHWYLNIVLHFP